MANPDRNGGGGLSLRTLVIASAASLTAAMVTSRLFPPGTVFAAALTPVIVAAVSELLGRPVDLVTQLREERRTLVLESRAHGGTRADDPLRGAPEFAQGDDAPPEATTNGHGAPITVHRRSRMRRIHPKVWIATGLAAFAVAVAALTLPELIFGGAVASEDRTTFFGGGGSSDDAKPADTQTETTTEPETTETETTPSQTPPAETETTPAPAEMETETTPAPSGGTPAPEETQPTPAPEGALPVP